MRPFFSFDVGWSFICKIFFKMKDWVSTALLFFLWKPAGGCVIHLHIRAYFIIAVVCPFQLTWRVLTTLLPSFSYILFSGLSFHIPFFVYLHKLPYSFPHIQSSSFALTLIRSHRPSPTLTRTLYTPPSPLMSTPLVLTDYRLNRTSNRIRVTSSHPT